MSEPEHEPVAVEEAPNGCAELPEPSESKDDAPRASRELKSILALSKEAKLDTNISTQRRKSKPTPRKSPKITAFPVTAESELESFELKIDEKKPPKKRSFTESETDGATIEEARRSVQGIAPDFVMSRKDNKDVFCWRCHHDSVQIACETCPRAYHLKCLKQTITDLEHWPCPECVSILKAENTQTRSKAMKEMTLDHLCSLLKFAVRRMIQCSGSEPFIHPVDEGQFPEYRNYIINPMTLTMLEKNIKNNLYGSTQAFEADAKWMLHNSIIFNSYQSKLTSVAKTIVKICKQEMAEIENCSSCYLNANTKKHTWFVEVCPKPHLLVWAKLKGFPYWPAKVMSVNSSGMADVRFFGAHDKAWVSVKDCYLYSIKDPNSGKQKRNDIIECVKELEQYVDNLREVYGRVNFAPFKTLLEADSQLGQLQVFLPSYRHDDKETMKKVIDRSFNNLNESVEESSESSECSTDDEEEDDDEEGEEGEEDDDDEETGEENERRSLRKSRGEEKTNGNKQVPITRIDYRASPNEKTRIIIRPVRTPVNRKRVSDDEVQQNSTKVAEEPVQENVSKILESPVKESENEEFTKESPKVKISDQLMKKLGDLDAEKIEIGSATVDDVRDDKMEEKDGADLLKENESESVEEIKSSATEEPPKKVEEATVTEGDASSVKDCEEKAPDTATEVRDDSSVVEDDDKPEDMVVEIDEANIRNIIHSSLVESPEGEPLPSTSLSPEKEHAKKRKHEETEKDKNEKEEADLFPPNKMVKLVPIENILQKKTDVTEATPPKDDLIVLKEVRMIKEGRELRNKTKKPEDEKAKQPQSVKIKNEIESDEDNTDVQYMEAKRQYLSALNISEKQKLPAKPKGHEIRTRSKTEEKKIKAVDQMTKTPEDSSDSTRSTPNKTETPPVKEVYIKSLSKMQAPKHKARKSFPTPNYGKKTIVARKIIPKSGIIDDELTIVNAATLQPTGNVMILPKLHYTKPLPMNRDMSSPPVLTMLPRPQLADQRKIPEGSQNYIPQNEEVATRAEKTGILLNNLLSGGSASAPPVIDVDAQQNPLDSELSTLKEILPENVSKGVADILCQPPPKLKPRPVGLLSSVTEAGVPSTAGPVASRLNQMADKLSDYFRSLLVETISELGKSNNPEATISTLKYEIEELKHKHTIELSEIRRNVSIVLKDIQKSVIEERDRIVNETKAHCEMEATKRVEDAKSKQWCANCGKEAQFYCCWNTSYCDYPCQQKHWPKHMSKCTQTTGQNTTATSTPVRPGAQQLVLTPTAAPKFGTLFAKPQKVYLKRANPAFKQTTGSHITLVESTPGNFELLGSGPITVNGKILASTSVIEKIKSGNIVTVTAPSGTASTQSTSASLRTKSTINSPRSEH